MTKASVEKLSPCSHKSGDCLTLKPPNPEPRLLLRIEDAPATDEVGHEIDVERYVFFVIVPGAEKPAELEEVYGGHVIAGRESLVSVLEIAKWLDAHLPALTREEGLVPPLDGRYAFLAYTKDTNGMLSRTPSNTVSLRLSMTPPNPPVISVEPVPSSIVQ